MKYVIMSEVTQTTREYWIVERSHEPLPEELADILDGDDAEFEREEIVLGTEGDREILQLLKFDDWDSVLLERRTCLNRNCKDTFFARPNSKEEYCSEVCEDEGS